MACHVVLMSGYNKNESQHKVFAEESFGIYHMIFMFVKCIYYHKTNLFAQLKNVWFLFQWTQKAPTFCVIHTHFFLINYIKHFNSYTYTIRLGYELLLIIILLFLLLAIVSKSVLYDNNCTSTTIKQNNVSWFVAIKWIIWLHLHQKAH